MADTTFIEGKYNMMPNELNILCKRYKVIYCTTQLEVDADGEEELSGQIDFTKREIRIFKTSPEDMWHTLFHEVLHAVAEELKLKIGEEENHKELDVLALMLTDVLTRNDLLKGYKRK